MGDSFRNYPYPPMYYGNLLTDDRPVLHECAAGDQCKHRVYSKINGQAIGGPIHEGDEAIKVPKGAVPQVAQDEYCHPECWEANSMELLSATRVQAGVE